jgi:NAD(P)-dependent dehydrogenase (short-subunit alcohol dehydrogenase family)
MPTALITGASSGFGRALALALGHRGWRIIIDARHEDGLHRVRDQLAELCEIVAVPGDVTAPSHRADLARVVLEAGGLDLLVNNASTLGPSPLPPLSDLDTPQLRDILEMNLVAPLEIVRSMLPVLRPDAVIVNVSSDAAVEAYPGWGGYGASKAALDLVTRTLAAEHPTQLWYSVDPGDMRTPMHQAAFPGEDISDRPDPEAAVPPLLALLAARPASGRYRLADVAVAETSVVA